MTSEEVSAWSGTHSVRTLTLVNTETSDIGRIHWLYNTDPETKKNTQTCLTEELNKNPRPQVLYLMCFPDLQRADSIFQFLKINMSFSPSMRGECFNKSESGSIHALKSPWLKHFNDSEKSMWQTWQFAIIFFEVFKSFDLLIFCHRPMDILAKIIRKQKINNSTVAQIMK